MTKEEVFETYKLRNGVIQDSGKFEGEMWWAPIVWEWVMGGNGEDHITNDGDLITIIRLNPQEMIDFKLESGILVAWERDDGFVYIDEWTLATDPTEL